MPTPKKKSTDGEKSPQKKSSNESIKDKVREHINNINHVFTDEDIRDAKLDMGEISDGLERKEQELKDEAGTTPIKDNKITPSGTTWDVLRKD